MQKGVKERYDTFITEYLIDFNAKRAYKVAYPTAKPYTCASNGYKLLITPYIKGRLRELQDKVSKKREVTLEMVQEGYRRLAFSDTRKFYNADGTLKAIHELDEETAYALEGFDVEERTNSDGTVSQVVKVKKIRTSARAKGLDGLARMNGYFAPDKIANTTTDGQDVQQAPLLSDKQFELLISTINAAISR
jgi:phage terminase small subunit